MVSSTARELQDGSTVIYRIDAEDRLIEVNDGWVAFAETNSGEGLHEERVIGRVLWEFLTDFATVHLYQLMCRRLRQGRPSIQFQFRCDAPELRRLLAMKMVCGAARSIEFTVKAVAEQARTPVPFVGVRTPTGSSQLISMCSWCKRVRVSSQEWVEVETGIEMLGLFRDQLHAPAVTHGICESCERALEGEPGKATVILGPLPEAGSWS